MLYSQSGYTVSIANYEWYLLLQLYGLVGQVTLDHSKYLLSKIRGNVMAFFLEIVLLVTICGTLLAQAQEVKLFWFNMYHY